MGDFFQTFYYTEGTLVLSSTHSTILILKENSISPEKILSKLILTNTDL